MAKNKPATRKPPGAKKADSSVWGSPLALLIALGAITLAFALPYLPFAGQQSAPKAPRQSTGKAAHEHAKAEAPAGTSCDVPAEEENDMCSAWHKAGLCVRKTHNVDMRRECARTCGFCPGVEPRNPNVARTDRCRRDNVTAAVPAGQLTPLFERILSDFPQYEPTALSTSPYVLLLKNFVSEEEAAAFQSVCKESFERSLAGDQVPPPAQASHYLRCYEVLVAAMPC